MLLVLVCIALFSGAILASVYNLTKEPIEQAKSAKQQSAIKEVLPEYARLDDAETVAVAGIGDIIVYKAYDSSNNLVGAAVESLSKNGFSGEIKVMVGFDAQGNIVNYSVLEQKETPGLGTKMVDWFKTDKAHQNILGKNPAKNKLKVTRDGGEVDAITAATISSRAFLETVQYAYAAFMGEAIDTNSGATSTTDTDSGATTDAGSGATNVENENTATETTDADSGATY